MQAAKCHFVICMFYKTKRKKIPGSLSQNYSVAGFLFGTRIGDCLPCLVKIEYSLDVAPGWLIFPSYRSGVAKLKDYYENYYLATN